MNNMNEFLKNLRHTTDRLTNMGFDQANAWQSIQDMQQMFNNDFWSNIGKMAPQPNSENTTAVSAVIPSETKFTPSIDVYETLGKVVVCCELPGLERNSFKLAVSGGTSLTMRGKIKEHHLLEYNKSKERFTGKFNRTIELPGQVSPKPIQVSYVDGILELFFVKKKAQS